MAWLSWDYMCKPMRLIIYPDSLVARIFQAKYYSNGFFLEACKGSRPSATWTSLLKARSSFTEGLRVRIGNGYSTDIWNSQWIPHDGNFRVITPRPHLYFFPYKVADLINPITGTWDLDMLENHFWPIDQARILSIPIGGIGSDDKLIWHPVKDGRFSVKSCYQLLRDSRASLNSVAASSSSGETQVKWRDIWALNLPPKVRMFLWQACSNILPHAAELYRRQMITDPYCVQCGLEVESLVHVFMVCRGLNGVWSDEPFNIPALASTASMWEIFYT